MMFAWREKQFVFKYFAIYFVIFFFYRLKISINFHLLLYYSLGLNVVLGLWLENTQRKRSVSSHASSRLVFPCTTGLAK